MSTKRKIYLPSIPTLIPGAAAGTVGLVDLPLYYDYHAIGFEYLDGGATPQDIIYGPLGNGAGNAPGGLLADIALVINTDVKRIHSAAELDHLNAVNGAIFARQQVGAAAVMRQILKLNFMEPWRTDKNDRLACVATLTPAFGVNSAQLKLTLGTAMPATGSLVLYAIVDSPKQAMPATGPLVKKVIRQQLQASGSSIDVTTLDKTGYYQTVLLKHPLSTFIAKATVKVNGTVIRELSRAANVADLIQQGMNPANSITPSTAGVPQFGYDIVLDDDDPINSALPVQGQDLQLKVDFDSANAATGNIMALIERVEFGW